MVPNPCGQRDRHILYKSQPNTKFLRVIYVTIPRLKAINTHPVRHPVSGITPRRRRTIPILAAGLPCEATRLAKKTLVL